jgi:outer membrane protein TolC
LAAAKLDVKVARAEFFPLLVYFSGVGYNAFKTSFLFKSPASLLYSLAGDLAAPLINRNAIKASAAVLMQDRFRRCITMNA